MKKFYFQLFPFGMGEIFMKGEASYGDVNTFEVRKSSLDLRGHKILFPSLV